MRSTQSPSKRSSLLPATLLALAACGTIALAQPATYRVDPARSHVSIHVGKAGIFSFAAGHSHDVTGPIQDGEIQADLADPSQSRIRLTIASSDLEVAAAEEPEGDAPKVQATMQSEKVLDISRYPEITYESSSVTVKSRQGSALDLYVTGQLTIRGVAREVGVPVRVEVGSGTLSADGHFEVKQTRFGIEPVSVGGVVSVKDTLAIDFAIVAAQ